MYYYPLTKAPKGKPQAIFIPAEPKAARIIESDTAKPKPKRKRFHKKKSKNPLASK